MLLTETRRKEQGDGVLKAEKTLAGYVLSHFLRKIDVEVVLPFSWKKQTNKQTKKQTKQNKNTKMFLDEFQDFRHSLGDSKGEVSVMADFKFISTTSTAVKVTSLLNDCCLQQLIN